MAHGKRFIAGSPNREAMEYELTRLQIKLLERALGGAKDNPESGLFTPKIVPVPIPPAALAAMMKIWRRYLFVATAFGYATPVKPYSKLTHQTAKSVEGIARYGKNGRWAHEDLAVAEADAKEAAKEAKRAINPKTKANPEKRDEAIKRASEAKAAANKARVEAEYDSMFEVGLGIENRPIFLPGYNLLLPESWSERVKELVRRDGVAFMLTPQVFREVADRATTGFYAASDAAPEPEAVGLEPQYAHGPTAKEFRVWARDYELPTEYSTDTGEANVLAWMVYQLFKIYSQYEGVHKPSSAKSLVEFMEGELPE